MFSRRRRTRDAFYATEAGDLDHWLDEGLGHWLWHLAWAALSVLMLWRATARRDWPLPAGWLPLVAGLIQGVTFFFVTVEGETTLLGIPLSLFFVAWTARETLARLDEPGVPVLPRLLGGDVAGLRRVGDRLRLAVRGAVRGPRLLSAAATLS